MSERIAVIAVHGVAYHEPGATANAVSELLLGLPEESGAKYGPFEAETVHIPLHPLKIQQPLNLGERGIDQKGLKVLEERTSFLTREWKTSKETRKSNTDVADDFMRLTLQDYRGVEGNKIKDARDATAYITTRLRTTREASPSGSGVGETGNGGSASPLHSSPAGPSDPNNTGEVDKKPIVVDVYEMYWADLFRPKKSIVSFFQALYQLLFHLASLSRLAISTGYLENQDQWQWRALEKTQKYAVRMITLPIPILNVLLFVTLFGVVPRLIPGLSDNVVAPKAAAIGALILGLLGYAIASRWFHAKRSPLSWALFPLVAAVPLAVFAYWAAYADSRHIVLSVEGLIVGSAIFRYSAVRYDGVRDGTKEVAFWLWLSWVGVFAWCWTCGDADSVQQATLWAMQIVLAALRFSWFLLFIFSIAAWALGECAWRCIDKNKDNERRARAKAAVRTSRLALAMPTLGILIVTLAFFSALFVKASAEKGQYGKSIAISLFGDSINKPLSGPGMLHAFFLDQESVKRYLVQPSGTFTIKTGTVKVSTAVNISANYNGDSQTTTLTVNPSALSLNLNPTTVTGGSPTTGTVTLNGPVPPNGAIVTVTSDSNTVPFSQGVTVTEGIAVAQICTAGAACLKPNDYFRGLFVWSATPGFLLVLLLIFLGLFLLILWALPSVFTEADEDTPVRSKNDLSLQMGAWLSRGLDATKIVSGLNWWAAFFVLPVFAISYCLAPPGWLQGLPGWLQCAQAANHFFLSSTAAILEYMGVVASSAAILTGLAGSGSSVLGIILDVDNYLRTSPKDETPRARIMERYVSLLQYLSDYKQPDGEGYDRVVIIAHSLGALISVDLLRFLKVQSDSQKIPIKIRLLTMGNPLRQLLNRFFPYLYEWVRPVPDNSLNPLRNVEQATPVIAAGASPTQNLLYGVERWLSAYRSGDYVGRSMWLDEWYNREAPNNLGRVYVASDGLTPPLRQEMCIGAGGHQHYWDQSAPDIAEKLDNLIWP
jgi:hypothetical protein